MNGYTTSLRRLGYITYRIDLRTARNAVLILNHLNADFIEVTSLVALNPVYLHLNYPDAAPIPLVPGRTIEIEEKGAIKRLYITNSAEPNGYVLLTIGGPERFRSTVPGTVQVAGFETNLLLLNQIKSLLAGELQFAATGNDLSTVLASCTTPLPAHAVYTSGFFNVDRYGKIVVTILSDQPGTLYVEQSNASDASVVDADEIIPYTAREKRGVWVEVVAPYCRVRYVNGSTDQTTFRLFARGRVI
jgi:hypothetical protein